MRNKILIEDKRGFIRYAENFGYNIELFFILGLSLINRLVNKTNIANQLSDESLMKLALEGESWAFENLYDRYADKLLRYIYRFVYDREQAEDLVHETFLKLIEKPGLFDADRKFSAWLYTIAGNLSRNHLRNNGNRQRLNRTLNPEEKHEWQSSTIDTRLLQKAIKSVFETLNDKEQEVFVLRFELDLSMKEISEIMGIPEGSVKSCLFYLLKKIAPQLNDFRHG